MDRKRITRSSRICTEKLVLNQSKVSTWFSPQTGNKFGMEGVQYWPYVLWSTVQYIQTRSTSRLLRVQKYSVHTLKSFIGAPGTLYVVHKNIHTEDFFFSRVTFTLCTSLTACMPDWLTAPKSENHGSMIMVNCSESDNDLKFRRQNASLNWNACSVSIRKYH
jgi:hypothetical protein